MIAQAEKYRKLWDEKLADCQHLILGQKSSGHKFDANRMSSIASELVKHVLRVMRADGLISRELDIAKAVSWRDAEAYAKFSCSVYLPLQCLPDAEALLVHMVFDEPKTPLEIIDTRLIIEDQYYEGFSLVFTI